MGKQGETQRVFALGTQSTPEVDVEIKGTWNRSPLVASIVLLIWDWWKRWKLLDGDVGVDWDQAKEPSSFFFSSSNLYPPLTPVPQCVAEFRAIGQSPIHCHPEYFKVKPPCLTKKSYSSKVYFSSSPSSPSFCSQSQGSAVVLHPLFSMVHCFVLPVRQEWEKLEVLKLESLKFEFNEVQFSLQ